MIFCFASIWILLSKYIEFFHLGIKSGFEYIVLVIWYFVKVELVAEFDATLLKAENYLVNS